MLYNSFTKYKNILQTFTIGEQLNKLIQESIHLLQENIMEILKIIDMKE